MKWIILFCVSLVAARPQFQEDYQVREGEIGVPAEPHSAHIGETPYEHEYHGETGYENTHQDSYRSARDDDEKYNPSHQGDDQASSSLFNSEVNEGIHQDDVDYNSRNTDDNSKDEYQAPGSYNPHKVGHSVDREDKPYQEEETAFKRQVPAENTQTNYGDQTAEHHIAQVEPKPYETQEQEYQFRKEETEQGNYYQHKPQIEEVPSFAVPIPAPVAPTTGEETVFKRQVPQEAASDDGEHVYEHTAEVQPKPYETQEHEYNFRKEETEQGNYYQHKPQIEEVPSFAVPIPAQVEQTGEDDTRIIREAGEKRKESDLFRETNQQGQDFLNPAVAETQGEETDSFEEAIAAPGFSGKEQVAGVIAGEPVVAEAVPLPAFEEDSSDYFRNKENKETKAQ